jgi:FkbM family methyltransferase
VGNPRMHERLEALLRTDPSDLSLRQKEAFTRLTADTGENFVLFGAGSLGKFTLKGLTKVGIRPVAFADNNAALWDSSIEGVPVLSPHEALHRFSGTALFVITVYTSNPVWKQLQSSDARVASFASLALNYPKAFLPHGDLDLPDRIFEQKADVRCAYDLWADDLSRREYQDQLEWRTTLDRAVLADPLPKEDIYFPDDRVQSLEAEVFVDCGAFDGDTIQEFIDRRKGIFEQIIAVEPDPENCRKLHGRLSALPEEIRRKIMVRQAAVGSRKMQVRFNATGTAASAVGQGSFEVECLTLDELLQDQHPTFIKLDIEGGESDALSGAERLIERDEPILAVCVYHKPEDLWHIPLQIQSLSASYRLFLRRYSDECWELVCYAVPAGRLRSPSGRDQDL